jgi:hypothetical protein
MTASILAILLSSQSVLASLFDRPDFFEQGRKQFEQEIRRLQSGQSVSESPLKVNIDSVSWMRFIFRKEGFTTIMPAGAITQETEMVKTPKGQIEFDLIATHPPDSRFVVAYSEVLSAEQVAEPSDVLDWSSNYIMENTAGGFTKTLEEDIIFNNYPGRDFTLKNQGETIMFRLLWIKQRLYVLAVSQEKQEISQEMVTKFFDSFEILPK